MTLQSLLHASVLVCTAYVILLYTTYLGLMLVGFVETRRHRIANEGDDLASIAGSRFAPGISVVVPAFNEEGALPAAVRSLLALDYTQFEVIVVNDGSTDGTLAELLEQFGLQPETVPSRDVVPTEPVVTTYRSPQEPRLLVIDKRGGGKADALNVGLNHCRHGYVCGVDADMVFAADALSRAMRSFMSDPATVVGLTSFIEIAADPSAVAGAKAVYPPRGSRPLTLFQMLDYLRAFYSNRIAWSRLDFMLCAVGAFQVWRRDVLDELQGWSRTFTCEDIELTFRVHKAMRERGLSYRVLCLPDRVGVTEGPDTLRKLVAQRERWQRVILETWWAYRGMCFNRRYGSVGLLGMPFYLLSEIVAPAFEILALVTLVVGAVTGLVDWWYFGLVLVLLALVNSVFSTGSLLMADRQSRDYRASGLARLVVLMPLELFFYRPVLSWARAKGTWRYLRGDKEGHKFERNLRSEAA